MAEKKIFLIQKAMLRVVYALIPPVIASIYLFGWRSLILIVVVSAFGIGAEALFTVKQGKPITSAIFVTCLIFSLSLPPTIPFWMAIIGILAGVIFGKMAFGGFGQNVFNPAMVGRCFIYIAFPTAMTTLWVEPFSGGAGGYASWTQSIDAMTRATPLAEIKRGAASSLSDLFFGNVAGSLGETSALLIILGGIFIIYKKAASWRLALSCLVGGILISSALRGAGVSDVASLVSPLLSGSFLFGSAFVVTEPISGPKTHWGQWAYGFMIGGLTMIFREYSNFMEGFMFAVILMNAFVPILDYMVRRLQGPKKVSA
jgi:Na+-transporting NADH:ubiquinone oxidoreductase subunit B